MQMNFNSKKIFQITKYLIFFGVQDTFRWVGDIYVH